MTREGTRYRSVALTDLKAIAGEIAGHTEEVSVWLFRGEMGSGKTTLIKEVCRGLGVDDVMSSPTFSIVNEYRTQDDRQVFHFDFYRIRSEAEAYDIGAEEYFYSGAPCFIEWPEKIPSLIPPNYAEVDITIENETERTIAISLHDGKEENRI
jgi:tRNA threonylcarbamoyladenosine biosynthesis protein TsaE